MQGHLEKVHAKSHAFTPSSAKRYFFLTPQPSATLLYFRSEADCPRVRHLFTRLPSVVGGSGLLAARKPTLSAVLTDKSASTASEGAFNEEGCASRFGVTSQFATSSLYVSFAIK